MYFTLGNKGGDSPGNITESLHVKGCTHCATKAFDGMLIKDIRNLYENLSDTTLCPNFKLWIFLFYKIYIFKAVKSQQKPSHRTASVPLYNCVMDRKLHQYVREN